MIISIQNTVCQKKKSLKEQLLKNINKTYI